MGGRMRKSRAVLLGFVAALAAAAILGGVMSGGASAISRASTITPAPAFTAAQLAATPSADWLTTGGDLTSQRYSSLNQITTANVRAQAGLEDEPRRIGQGGEVLAGGYADRSQRCHLHPHGQQRHLRPRRHDGRAPLEVRVEDRPEQQHVCCGRDIRGLASVKEALLRAARRLARRDRQHDGQAGLEDDGTFAGRRVSR